MIIQTKFDYGDTVFFIRDNRVQSGKIVEVAFVKNVHNDGNVRYKIPNESLPGAEPDSFYEHKLFATFEELRDSLQHPTP